MAEIRLEERGGPAERSPMDGGEPSIGELFGQLASDATRLVQQEVALAKAELRETGSTLARDGAKLGVAAGLGLLGAIAGMLFLIVALGDLLDNYWLSALIVSVVFLGIAAYLGKNALDDIKRRGVTPDQTMQTLREDADWAKREAKEAKRDLTA